MELNVHELINMPGYGKANVAVQKAGKWDFGPIERLEMAIADAQDAIDGAESAIDDAMKQLEALKENQQ